MKIPNKKQMKQIEEFLQGYPFLLILLNQYRDSSIKNPPLELKKKFQICINIEKSLPLLSTKEINFVKYRYFENKTIIKISDLMTYSEQSIYLIRKSALCKLFHSLYPFLIEKEKLVKIKS